MVRLIGACTAAFLAAATGIAAQPAADDERRARQIGDARQRAGGLLGHVVVTPEGQPVGRVVEVLVSDGGQLITLGVSRPDRGPPVAVPASEARMEPGQGLVVDLTPEQWAALPPFDPGQPAIGREPAPPGADSRTD